MAGKWKVVRLMGPDGTVVDRVTQLDLKIGQTLVDKVTGQRMTVLIWFESPQ